MPDSPFEPRISLITLGVADLARARAFYENGLGWRASPASQGDIVFFQLGGLALALFPRAELAADAGVADEGHGFRGIALAHNVRESRGRRPLLALAEAPGGRITRSAETASWGGRSGYFADPDGHLWEIAWNPHFDARSRRRGAVAFKPPRVAALPDSALPQAAAPARRGEAGLRRCRGCRAPRWPGSAKPHTRRAR